MLERFVKEARGVAADAHEEARARGSSTVEAEHVLLALTRDTHGPASEILARSGLDHASLLAMLESEFERSLDVAGVTVDPLRGAPALPFAGRLRWGASAKSSLEGALKVARARGDRRVEPAHILLAVLNAREGTVPRALRGAGVAPGQVIAEAQAAMDRP